MMCAANRQWHEDSIQSREEELEKRFGPTSPPGHVIKAEPNWDDIIPGFAFLRYAPRGARNFWLYVTHGLSQPAQYAGFVSRRAGGLSGFGVEFAIATSNDEPWPIVILDSLASYALYGSKPVLPLDRICSSDLMEESPGGHLLALVDPGYETVFNTLSGKFHIVHFVGTTASEIAKAKRHEGVIGSKILEEVLRHYGIGCITDRKRPSLTCRSDFDHVWKACQDNLPDDKTERP